MKEPIALGDKVRLSGIPGAERSGTMVVYAITTFADGDQPLIGVRFVDADGEVQSRDIQAHWLERINGEPPIGFAPSGETAGPA